MASMRKPSPECLRQQVFATTHWSVVVAAGRSDASGAREAISRLCQVYWYPLYAYVRRRGHSPQDAEDLTQGFFLQLLEHNWIARADQNKGRFRSFLLMTLDRFLANEWDKSRARKRGGHLRQVSLVMTDAENRFSREPADTTTPEQEFDRQWALTVLDQVLGGLRDEYARRGQAELFDALKPTLIGSRTSQPYGQLGAVLGMSEGSVQAAVFRLRQRYRERLKGEIAQTVASPEDVESEVRHLFRVLARR
jgi:RNA polymerase sigma factor (sigma-70 family)